VSGTTGPVCLCHRLPLAWEARELLTSLTEIGAYPLGRGRCVHGRLPAHEPCPGCDHALGVYDAMLEAPTNPVEARRWFAVIASLTRHGGELTLAGPSTTPQNLALIRLVATDEKLDITLEPLPDNKARLHVPEQPIDAWKTGHGS